MKRTSDGVQIQFCLYFVQKKHYNAGKAGIVTVSVYKTIYAYSYQLTKRFPVLQMFFYCVPANNRYADSSQPTDTAACFRAPRVLSQQKLKTVVCGGKEYHKVSLS
jgi:hypothetical protein